MQVNFQTINNIIKNRQLKMLPKEQNANVDKTQFATINPFRPRTQDSFEISFGSDHCSVQNFEIKNIENLRCPACGLIMLNDKQISSFVADVGSKKGDDLIATLEKYEDESTITGRESLDATGHGVYRPIKKQVVDVIKKLAKENPNMNIAQLVGKHAKSCIDSLISKQMVVVEELRSYIIKYIDDETEKKAVLEILDEHVKQIKGESDEDFARKRFIYNMKRAVSSYDQKQAVEEIASKLPTSETDVNSFFVKYSKETKMRPNVIAEKLVNTTKPTAEHLKPKSKGGRDRISNYICDCADCNSKRGNMDFSDWAKTIPDFEEKLQTYIYDVQDAIDDECLHPRYDSYIEQVVDTIATLSEGEIVLEMPDPKNPKKIAALMQKRQRELDKIISSQEKLEAKKAALEDEIKKLENYEHFSEADEYREIKEQLNEVAQETSRLSDILITLRKPLYILKNEVSALEDAVSKAKTPEEKRTAQQEYNKKNKEYEQKQNEYNAYENKLNKLRRKRIKLKKQKRGYSARENELIKRIEGLRVIVTKASQANEKLTQLGDIEQKENDLIARIDSMSAFIKELEAQNAEILADESFNPRNRKPYEIYLHKMELLSTADKLLQSKTYKKIGPSAGLTRELVEISKKSVQDDIDKLLQEKEVIYFINLGKIKNESEKREKQTAKLDEILKLRKQAEDLQKEISSLCGTRSIESVQQELRDALDEKRTREDIYKLTDKRKQLEHLTKLAKRNSISIEKLKNHHLLTNAEWAEITSFIDFDDTF